MKKFLLRDKLLRVSLKKNNKKYFILKSVLKNFNLFLLLRQKAYLKLKQLTFSFSKVSIVDRCLHSYNKKRFNKYTFFSRLVLLKLIKDGKISGFYKASW